MLYVFKQNILFFEIFFTFAIICYIFLFPIKRGSYNFQLFILFYSCIMQFFSFFSYFFFDCFLIKNSYTSGFQYFFTLFQISPIGLEFSFGLDGFAIIFIILSIFIFNICFFSLDPEQKEFYTYLKLLLVLEFILIIIFSILDLFFFYFFFEASLIPMFFLVGVWGSRARRIKATFYLFFYTMISSLLTLFVLMYIILQVGSTFYPDLLFYQFSESEQLFLGACVFITFATKIPIMPFHIWLPEAHVEAPTVGSIILASILLKIGGFGFLRYLLPIFPQFANYFLPLIYTLSMISVIYAALTTLRQIDLKRIIAYSSIAHMNFVILGIFSNSIYGVDGGFYLMIGHGIVSTALFFLVGLLYSRYHTRLISYYSGLIQVMPICGFFFFIFSLGNIGFPGTSNFIGEVLILIGLYERNAFIAFLAGVGIILSAVYSFLLFTKLFFGALQTNYFSNFSDLTINEFIVLFALLICLILFGINSCFILDISTLNSYSILYFY